ncbi:hypothetical protein [Streptomyces vinaceus]|uniref:hypothetical protein n=1 Tax=Streptomyces vinaceus TaxID=1960 RepID=UPI00382F867A
MTVQQHSAAERNLAGRSPHRCHHSSCHMVYPPSEPNPPSYPSSVCAGFDMERDTYFWNCTQCMIWYPGFGTLATAYSMARVHSDLRSLDHRVGRAIRHKSRAGLPRSLSVPELSEALDAGRSGGGVDSERHAA